MPPTTAAATTTTTTTTLMTTTRPTGHSSGGAQTRRRQANWWRQWAPITRWPALNGLVMTLAMLLLIMGHDDYRPVMGATLGSASTKRPVFFSELQLRSAVEMVNGDLRQLKRDFMHQMTDIYLRLKLDQLIGWPAAAQLLATHQDSSAAELQRPAAAINLLLAEQFAEMAISEHVIQRRLLAGLKLVFVKLLPMQTLVRLQQKFKAFDWLKDQAQVDLRPRFKGATENQFVALYSLIDLRARLRAAEDAVRLSRANFLRCMQIVQYYLIASVHGLNFSAFELNQLAQNANLVLRHYSEQVLEARDNLRVEWNEMLLGSAGRKLAELFSNGQRGGDGGGDQRAQQQKLVHFMDELINHEALDIDLNPKEESQQQQQQSALDGGELPPTISGQMIEQLKARWVPAYVLNSVAADRQLLLQLRQHIAHLVRVDPARQPSEDDIRGWLAYARRYLCNNQAINYGPVGPQYQAGYGYGYPV